VDRHQHIDDVLTNGIRPLMQDASDILEALKPGERMPATELAKRVAEKHGTTGAAIYPVLLFLFNGYPNFKKSRGARGGLERVSASEEK
jgi:hypothetical protein